MRFIVMIKGNAQTEAGIPPSPALFAEMTRFNEELVDAGVMVGGEGLHPSSKGARVEFTGGKLTVTDGPFAEAKELIAGYWIFKTTSLEEAIEWVKRCPNPDNDDFQIEIRQIFELEEFGEELNPELREREMSLRDRLSGEG